MVRDVVGEGIRVLKGRRRFALFMEGSVVELTV
jgi:hypothetical protein